MPVPTGAVARPRVETVLGQGQGQGQGPRGGETGVGPWTNLESLGYGACAQGASSTKVQEEMGSSVAHTTIGTDVSQRVRPEDDLGTGHPQIDRGGPTTTSHRPRPPPHTHLRAGDVDAVREVRDDQALRAAEVLVAVVELRVCDLNHGRVL